LWCGHGEPGANKVRIEVGSSAKVAAKVKGGSFREM
jgi:hypothetical protein